ncbi:MAG: hypothetical protein IT285_13090 [Bdellovibrionales bacterium]|nr:hypothetical protein [Bdellovibrionales bacterium]
MAVAISDTTFLVAGENGQIVVSSDGTTWSNALQLPFPGNPHLRGADYGLGMFVVVGDGGLIGTSEDGETWTTQDSGTTEDLVEVKISEALMVAVGAEGGIYTSFDGEKWTQRATSSFDSLRDITFFLPQD